MNSPYVRVAVDHRFAEYKAIVREFTPHAARNKMPEVNRNLPWNRPWAEKAFLALLLPAVFLFKKRRVGRCSFEFTGSGLARTSKGGTMARTWKQVAKVHRLTCAYLIELEEGGAMPVPYRVFGAAERAAFEELLSQQPASE